MLDNYKLYIDYFGSWKQISVVGWKLHIRMFQIRRLRTCFLFSSDDMWGPCKMQVFKVQKIAFDKMENFYKRIGWNYKHDGLIFSN